MPVLVITQHIANLNVATDKTVFDVSGLPVTAGARAVVYTEKRDGQYTTATIDVTCGPSPDAAYAFPSAVSVAAGPGRSSSFTVDGRYIVAEVGTVEGAAGSAYVHLVIITE